MRPNAPRMITVLAAVALAALGLVLIYLPDAQVADMIRQLPLGADLTRQLVGLAAQQTIAWAALALSPVLLVVGSLVRGL
jgi:hypothetical protein